MANIKSQKKRILQAEKSRARNKAHISESKTLIKKALEADKEENQKDALNKVYKKFDQLVSKKIVHQNKANRTKSRVAKQINKK